MGVVGAAQAGVALVVELAVLDAEVADEGPDLGVAPVDHGVDADKVGPAAVGAVEVGERRAVGVGAAGADEDGPDGRVAREVRGEGGAQRRARRVRRVPRQLEVVLPRRLAHERLDGGERVRRERVDGGDGGHFLSLILLLLLVLQEWMQTRQEQHQQHQAVLAPVVRQRQLRQRVPRQRRRHHLERGPGLALRAREERVWCVRLGEEGVHAGVEVRGDGGEGGCC